MRAAFHALPAALLSFVIAVGCGAPSIDGDLPPYNPKGKVSKDKKGTTDGEEDTAAEEEGSEEEPVPSSTPPAPSSTSPTPDAGPPPPAAGECSASTTRNVCFDCCEQKHPQGLPFLQQAFGNCVCGAGAGNCSAECGATFCAGAAPSALCEQCLDAADTCRLQADTACQQNAGCNAMFQCDDSSQCAAKP